MVKAAYKAISAQAHGEAADNRLLRKKFREKDELISDLRAQIESLNRNLSEKVSQMADMMDKLVAFMMGRGDVTLSDSLRDAVVSGVRAEYEMRERKLKEEFSRQLDRLSSEFEARLAAKQNEINALKGDDGGDGGDTPSTSFPRSSMPVTPEEMAARNKQLEQQKTSLQVTESLITHSAIMNRDGFHYFKRWIFCYYAPLKCYIRNYKLDPVKYLCDVFRRIKNTADDKLIELLAHRWQPSTASSWV